MSKDKKRRKMITTEEAAPEMAHAERVQRAVQRKRADREADLVVAGDAWNAAEFTSLGMSYAESLRRERVERKFLVHNMFGAKHNGNIAGNNGVGKTTLGINLIGSLVDGKPFLGAETALPLGGRVEWWNGEMDIDDFNDYARPIRIKRHKNITLRHLRDYRVSILNDAVAETVVKELRANDIKVWCVDSWAQMVAWCGCSENSNDDISKLTTRINEIKRQADVHAFIVLSHTGRVRGEEGEEHTRGAQKFDDWVDTRWTYLKPDAKPESPRFLSTLKCRGTHDRDRLWSQEIRLSEDNLVSLGDAVRGEAVDRDFLEAVIAAVTAEPGMNGTEVGKRLGIAKSAAGNKLGRHLSHARDEGRLYSEPKGNAKLWFAGVQTFKVRRESGQDG